MEESIIKSLIQNSYVGFLPALLWISKRFKGFAKTTPRNPKTVIMSEVFLLGSAFLTQTFL